MIRTPHQGLSYVGSWMKQLCQTIPRRVYISGTVSVLLGDGHGSFGPQQTFAAGPSPISVGVADLGDGHPDIVVANFAANALTVLRGDGHGSFQSPQTFAPGRLPISVAVADV